MEKIAILGGTFNPIHMGHLIAAQSVYDTNLYSKILFMPSNDPPHKDEHEVINPVHRLNMCELAIHNNNNFDISTLELEREGVTYTADTIRELSLKNPNTLYHFIIGADSLMGLLNWKSFEELIKITNFVVVNRYGYEPVDFYKHIDYLRENYDAHIDIIEMPNIDISSSNIRQRMLENKSIKYLVHHCVEEYIYENNLYQDDSLNDVSKSMLDKLENRLSEKRLIHSIGVKNTAIKLAIIYNVDSSKASIAGLLHDCAKNYDNDKKLKLCQKYKIKLSKEEKENPDLTHAKLGAKIANDKYEITDKDVLDAIKCHTTGKPKMTDLEKIIYISDFIEPSRISLPAIEKAREMAANGLDETVFFILGNTINYLEETNHYIDNKSYKAYEYYKKLLAKKGNKIIE
jgi:nicotinate-nucleotide adenylyltransferase